MVYHHRQVGRELFEKYRRRYSPYGSVASLYLWAVAGGAVPELRDYGAAGKERGRSDMTAWQSYASPVGELLLAADEEA